MAQEVLGLATSPRRDGNSDLLLRECLRGAADAGAHIELFDCRTLKITGCMECNACFKTGRCAINDDMQPLYDKMIACDRLVFATPMFFMTVGWRGKMVIDRCQCLWARKYVLKHPLYDPPRPDRKGVLLAVGATRGKKLFDGVQMVMKYFFDALEMTYAGNVLVRGVDAKGDILQRPEALAEAYELGKRLAT
jgi:multimeric flavodoxin WrbA